MAEKKITRKVISKAPSKEVSKKAEETQVDTKQAVPETGSSREAGRPKKVCFFCQSKTDPLYTDTNILRRFTSDRAKIVPRAKSGLCSRHQRAVTRNIKYARHLALLPFTPLV